MRTNIYLTMNILSRLRGFDTGRPHSNRIKLLKTRLNPSLGLLENEFSTFIWNSTPLPWKSGLFLNFKKAEKSFWTLQHCPYNRRQIVTFGRTKKPFLGRTYSPLIVIGQLINGKILSLKWWLKCKKKKLFEFYKIGENLWNRHHSL